MCVCVCVCVCLCVTERVRSVGQLQSQLGCGFVSLTPLCLSSPLSLYNTHTYTHIHSHIHTHTHTLSLSLSLSLSFSSGCLIQRLVSSASHPRLSLPFLLLSPSSLPAHLAAPSDIDARQTLRPHGAATGSEGRPRSRRQRRNSSVERSTATGRGTTRDT